MNLDTFARKLRAVEVRVESLSDRATAGINKEPNLLPDAFEQLSETVEELHVAEEELRAQNEELLAASAGG